MKTLQLALCAGLALTASVVAGQPAKPPAKPATPTAKPVIFQSGPFDSLSLLRRKEVQTELKLSPDQVKALSGGSGGRIAPEPGAARKIVNKVLNPTQQLRYQEIVLQQQGIRGATHDEVAQALGLSKAQLNRMYKIIEDVNIKNMDLASKQISESEMKALGEKNNATVEPSLMAVLTPAQKTTWTKLLGKPFKLAPATPAGGSRRG